MCVYMCVCMCVHLECMHTHVCDVIYFALLPSAGLGVITITIVIAHFCMMIITWANFSRKKSIVNCEWIWFT